jgi:hypothetical protein
MRSFQASSHSSIHNLVEHAIASGRLSRKEHLKLTSLLLAEQVISTEEREQINQVFDYLQAGRLKLVD